MIWEVLHHENQLLGCGCVFRMWERWFKGGFGSGLKGGLKLATDTQVSVTRGLGTPLFSGPGRGQEPSRPLEPLVCCLLPSAPHCLMPLRGRWWSLSASMGAACLGSAEHGAPQPVWSHWALICPSVLGPITRAPWDVVTVHHDCLQPLCEERSFGKIGTWPLMDSPGGGSCGQEGQGRQAGRDGDMVPWVLRQQARRQEEPGAGSLEAGCRPETSALDAAGWCWQTAVTWS